MPKFVLFILATLVMLGAIAPSAMAEAPLRRELDMMKGVWKGEEKVTPPGKRSFTATRIKRVGVFESGDTYFRIFVLDSHTYDGTTLKYGTFGVIALNARTECYELRAYGTGPIVTTPVTFNSTSVQWDIPMPGGVNNTVLQVTIDFSTPGVWHETDKYVVAGQAPVLVAEMTLKRVKDTNWPETAEIHP